ncbi:hypothetical protein DCS_04780 [Drechmeria coniospora]|uniref:UV excision repair protein n=1 Tax=Drechmeria coniospora TaxID=98403 RepID=A0A151GKZ4_DRECN|nr:hypothetical protein DCS_04780 [Drechmeria coniospora]KYK57767.1 hypothetical protein DCS_04780 [Drechmeria coniospora]ODA79655.1 hypothetical protein RJ55_05249 [Drechmeria coniospora]
MARTILALGGTVAVLATATAICLQIVVAAQIETPTLRIATIVAASLHFAVLLMLGWLSVLHILLPGKVPSSRRLSVALGCELFICTLAAAGSCVALACLGRSKEDDAGAAALTTLQGKLFAGLSATLALAFVSQLFFIIAHFLFSRNIAQGRAPSLSDGEVPRMPRFHVKSIRYSQTNPTSRMQEMSSVEKLGPIPATKPMSTHGSIHSFKSSVSLAMRPSSSKGKLLATSKGRPPSLDSTPGRTSAETSFDSWDTSSVDVHNRQVVLEMSSPTQKSCSLETIPASPSGSRSQSPGSDPTLERPPTLRRSRSYSASTIRQLEEAGLNPRDSIDERNIHPLFRSDSPTPPLVVTPGTSVVASPIAGQVITRRESMQSLHRSRSEVTLSGPSPLSRQTSVESTKQKQQGEARAEGEAQHGRKMTPPIPEWLLSPSMQASMAAFTGSKESRGDAEIASLRSELYITT